MATLVLSTVGTILGGPLGGAIGSLVGQSIDQQLFGGGARQGPRLGDLSVQTSSYGTPIPRVFGTMRVAGSIIWSTDLQEASETQGAKGQPETVTYSYSASFAVALSSRPINAIKRIWADGKLIRTAEGEFSVATGFRLLNGLEDQALDPLIASVEGVDATPAYRGLALAVFEDLQLAEFGNRIPFLTFEVEADAEPPEIATILADVSEGAIAATSPKTLLGYAAHGPTIASAVESLVDLFGIALVDDGITIRSPLPKSIEPSDDEMGCGAGNEPRPRFERSQMPESSLPSALALNYYNPAREYQAGLARAAVDTAAGRGERLELAAVLDAGDAKALAETSLARKWAERDQLTVRLPPAHIAATPGAEVRLAGGARRWKVERITVESLAVIAELRPVYSTIGPVPADPGRVLSSTGVVPTATTMSLVELPDDGTGDVDSPVVALAATSNTSRWRPVPLTIDVGSSAFAGQTAASATVAGRAATVLADGQSLVLDCSGAVEVELSNSGDWIESRSDADLCDGANIALLGSEVFQFGDAEPLGDGCFRLSRLLRGRRGTEWAMAMHRSGETFVMLDAARLRLIPVANAQIGTKVRVTANGLADGDLNWVELAVVGEAMRPPSPAHLRAWLDTDGNLHCSWIRRSRKGWAWLDGVDAPLGCASERYVVTLDGASSSVEVQTVTSEIALGAAEVAGLGAQITVSVVQAGDFALSRPASLTFPIS
ncbi:MAG TPA: phage tail protein [Sphingomicrobium sp.]|nr:phage tail protein [Sphingomicrobium sp.]